MKWSRTGFRVLAPAALALVSQAAAADLLLTLGEQDFTDGSTLASGAFLTAGSGEPAPFDGIFSGADNDSNFSASWTFASYGAQPTILGASLTLGILDHESAASGSQVSSFTLNGIDLTSEIDSLFESSGGASSEYNLYTLALPNSVFATLGSGTASFALALQGPGLGLFGESAFNGAALDFSTLRITTTTQPPTNNVLEPATAALLTVALAGFAGAAIAGSEPMETSLQAWKFAKGLYLIPLFMVYNEPIVMGGPVPLVLWNGLIVIIALVAFAAVLEGFLWGPMPIWMRLALVPAIVGVFWPSVTIEAVGAAVIVVLLAMNRLASRRGTAPA